jgi:histidine triad (HIT) family protein
MPYTIPSADRCPGCEGLSGGDAANWVEIETTAATATYITDRQRSVGSVLVLPRRHVAKFTDLSDSECDELVRAVHRIAGAIRREYDPDGLHVWTGTGEIAGQSMGHMHMQVVPRYEGQAYSFAPSDALPITALRAREQQAMRLRVRMAEDVRAAPEERTRVGDGDTGAVSLH